MVSTNLKTMSQIGSNWMISKYWLKSNMIWNHHQKDFSSIQTVFFLRESHLEIFWKDNQPPALLKRPDSTSLSLGFVCVFAGPASYLLFPIETDRKSNVFLFWDNDLFKGSQKMSGQPIFSTGSSVEVIKTLVTFSTGWFIGTLKVASYNPYKIG